MRRWLLAGALALVATGAFGLMGAIATHAINPSLYRNFPYDPVRDFRHVALLVQVPNVLVVNTAVPVSSVDGLIAYAKQRPGKLNFASGSTGSPAACSSCSTTSRAPAGTPQAVVERERKLYAELVRRSGATAG